MPMPSNLRRQDTGNYVSNGGREGWHLASNCRAPRQPPYLMGGRYRSRQPEQPVWADCYWIGEYGVRLFICVNLTEGILLRFGERGGRGKVEMWFVGNIGLPPAPKLCVGMGQDLTEPEVGLSLWYRWMVCET